MEAIISLDVAIFLFNGIPNGHHQVTLIYLKTQGFRTFQKDLVGSIWWSTEPEKIHLIDEDPKNAADDLALLPPAPSVVEAWGVVLHWQLSMNIMMCCIFVWGGSIGRGRC